MFKIQLYKDNIIIFLSNKIFLQQKFFFLKVANGFSLYHYYFMFSFGILQRFGLCGYFSKF